MTEDTYKIFISLSQNLCENASGNNHTSTRVAHRYDNSERT